MMLFGPTLPGAAVGRAKVLLALHTLIRSRSIANAAKTDEGNAYNLHFPLAFSMRASARLNLSESTTVISQSQLMIGFPLGFGTWHTRIDPRFSAGRFLSRFPSNVAP
jgi:hypothetical protein